MKILKYKFIRQFIIICMSCVIIGSILLIYFPAQSQSLQSPSYANQLILAFFTARLEHKQHDAEILKALLMVQEHPSDKIKLAKICAQFVKDKGLKDK